MIRLRLLAGEATRAASPVAVKLTDDFTGEPPVGRLNPRLMEVLPDGTTTEVTTVRPRLTPTGVLIYPNLGLVASAPRPLRFRLTLAPDYYRPYYLRHKDFLAFDFPAWRHDPPPDTAVASPVVPLDQTADYRILLPSADYPFAAGVTVLYGQVVTGASPAANVRVAGSVSPALAAVLGAAGAPIVTIRYGTIGIALTGPDGRFALPLKSRPGPLVLDLTDDRDATRTKQVSVNWTNRTQYLKPPIVFP